ncbi:MAG: hypothetical protein IPL28_06175 [Chloroflexi bacterium]|nr:hypothetical protein [Chloroflexota bacterium]
MVENGNVEIFQTAANGRVIYTADQRTDEVVELFATYQQSTIFLPLVTQP